MTIGLSALLDEIRAIALTGLHYSHDDYDRERYERLLQLTANEYASESVSPQDLITAFRKDIGYITPKVGCSAAIFNEEGHMLLVKRSDNGKWGLPAGFCEVNQTPRDNLKREIREETGLEADVGELLDVFAVLPGQYGQPHSLYALLFACSVTGGTLTTSHETPIVGYFDHHLITDWHFDHQQRAARAYHYWLSNRT